MGLRCHFSGTCLILMRRAAGERWERSMSTCVQGVFPKYIGEWIGVGPQSITTEPSYYGVGGRMSAAAEYSEISFPGTGARYHFLVGNITSCLSDTQRWFSPKHHFLCLEPETTHTIFAPINLCTTILWHSCITTSCTREIGPLHKSPCIKILELLRQYLYGNAFGPHATV